MRALVLAGSVRSEISTWRRKNEENVLMPPEYLPPIWFATRIFANNSAKIDIESRTAILPAIPPANATVMPLSISRLLFPGFEGSHDRFDLILLFEEDAAAGVVFFEDVAVAERGEEAGAESFFQRRVFDVDIGVSRERARLRAAVGVDVEESSSCGEASARAFFVARE